MKTILSIAFVWTFAIVTMSYGQSSQPPGPKGADAISRYVALAHAQLHKEIAKSKERGNHALVRDLEGKGIFHPSIGTMPWDRPMEVGDIGHLVARCATILQVLDASNVLAETEWRQPDSFAPIKREETVWITGISTQGLVDGRQYKTDQIFDVVGTKTYKTSGGTNTVLVLKAVAADNAQIQAAYQEYLAQANEKVKAPREAQREAVKAEEERQRTAKQRMWTSGKHTVKAEFITVIGDKVTLKRLDNGKEITLPMELLSKQDQEFIRERKWLTATASPVTEQPSKSVTKTPATAKPPPRNSKIPPDAVAFQGHHYFLYFDRRKRRDADARCKSLGGYLARVDSDEERNFLIGE